MNGYTEEELNKEVTITRKEFAKLVAENVAEVTSEAPMGDALIEALVTRMLVQFSAILMTELFDNDEDRLEVESNE